MCVSTRTYFLYLDHMHMNDTEMIYKLQTLKENERILNIKDGK